MPPDSNIGAHLPNTLSDDSIDRQKFIVIDADGRTWNPLVVIGQLIRHHESGRYSMANLQILLWTILVVYALCFNWIVTGELLNISPGVLVLLGISGTTSVLARAMESQGGQRTFAPPVNAGSIRDLVTTAWCSSESRLRRHRTE